MSKHSYFSRYGVPVFSRKPILKEDVNAAPIDHFCIVRKSEQTSAA